MNVANRNQTENQKQWFRKLSGIHWEKRVIAVCVYVILSQWVVALVPYWYEETIAMTRKMLDAMLVVALLFPAIPWLRMIVGVGVVIWSVKEGGQQFEIWNLSLDGSIPWQAYHPYIWLVGLIWSTYEIFIQSVRWTWNVIILLVIQLIVFGALDSFTEPDLWTQVAWLTGASLVWLIAVHFSSMNRKYPHMLRGSVRYPLQMLISAVVLISIIITSGVSMPRVQPILQDPYTAWVNKGNDGSLFGSGTGNGNSYSGYSRNDQQLGGGFELDYTPVMSVRTDARGYWRGETKSTYIGDGWKDTLESELQTPKPKEQLIPEMSPDSSVPTRKIKQSITMLNTETYPILFGMGTMSSFQIENVEEAGMVQWGPRDGELWYHSEEEAYPQQYSIVSEVVVIQPSLVSEASEDGKSPEYSLDEKWDPYLRLPDNIPSRVHNLAYELTANATSDYERAVLIEEYLKSQFQYTTTPDLSKKVSEDFVDSFLFEIKEGYCDYYSTSMAVMLRSLGVPTRWVKGYAPGVNSDMMDGSSRNSMNNMEYDPDGSGTYRVTNADAHSWVEVWMDEYGWVAFEPTPGFYMSNVSEEEEKEQETPIKPEENEEKKQDEPELMKDESEASIPAWIGTAAKWIVIAAALFALGFVIKRWSQVGFSLRWYRLLQRNLTPRERIILETEMWLSYCRMKGWRRSEDETIREMAARWFATDRVRKKAAEDIIRIFEEAKYGGRELNEADWQQLKITIRRFKHPSSSVL